MIFFLHHDLLKFGRAKIIGTKYDAKVFTCGASGVVCRTGSVTAGWAFQRLAMRSPILFRRLFHCVRTRTAIAFSLIQDAEVSHDDAHGIIRTASL
jgi:hypothetical protein